MQEEERIELDRENKMMTHECEYIQRERTRKRVRLQSISPRNFQARDRDVLWQYHEIEEADTDWQSRVYSENSCIKLDENGKLITKSVFVGFDSYKSLIRFDKIKKAFNHLTFIELKNVEFWKAFRFTVTFCLITLPLVISFGLLIALTVNNLTSSSC